MSPKEELLEKVIDLIYGAYDPQDISVEDQNEYIKSFKDRLIKWKIDLDFRKIIGPLQPPIILSKMVKVPVDVIEQIALELNIDLPESVDMSEFNIERIPETEVVKLLDDLKNDSLDTEQNILEILATIEKEKINSFNPTSFEYLDMTQGEVPDEDIEKYLPNSYYMIQYLESCIEKIKLGEIKLVSIISILNDDKASIYLPPSMTEDIKLYNPIIELLVKHSEENNKN